VGPTGKDPSNRRLHERKDLMLKVEYAETSQFLADFTENVSQGGVFIATEEQFKVGMTIEFMVGFPGLLDPIPMKGVIKWCRTAVSETEPAGIGVQFLNEQSPGRSAFQQLVNTTSQELDPAKLPKQPFRVLLVEDNLVVREMFRFGIQKFTQQNNIKNVLVEVGEASDGKVAWDLLQKETFHLLIIDLYMPVMDGGTLVQYVRKDPNLQDIPILVVSSGGQEGRQAAIDCGADVYLDKPVKLKQMTETIATLIAIGHFPRRR
jgi:uncharacterized protein (TIGR02266 family)